MVTTFGLVSAGQPTAAYLILLELLDGSLESNRADVIHHFGQDIQRIRIFALGIAKGTIDSSGLAQASLIRCSIHSRFWSSTRRSEECKRINQKGTRVTVNGSTFAHVVFICC